MDQQHGPSLEKRGLTVDEFIAGYGIGRTTTYEEIASGRLKAVKLGRRTIIPRDAAEAWLASLPKFGVQRSI